jgi:predicted nucleic acid-binding Zn ribbon protein
VGSALEKSEEKSGRKNLRQICLVCGAENEAEEAVCKKCGRPIGTPQLSRKRNILEIVAVFAFFIALIFLVVLFLRMYLFPR